MIIVAPSFSKSSVLKRFPSTLKWKAGGFEEHFRKAPFSLGVSVDGRPNLRNRLCCVFKLFYQIGVLFTGKQHCYFKYPTEYYKQRRREHKNQLHATLQLPLCRYIRELCFCHLSKFHENTLLGTYRNIIVDENRRSQTYRQLFMPSQPIFLQEIIIHLARRVRCLYLNIQFNSLYHCY